MQACREIKKRPRLWTLLTNFVLDLLPLLNKLDQSEDDLIFKFIQDKKEKKFYYHKNKKPFKNPKNSSSCKKNSLILFSKENKPLKKKYIKIFENALLVYIFIS
jgi:hypothetical protein